MSCIHGVFPHFLNSPAVSVSSVSGVLGIMEQIESKLLHFIFGVAELILTSVGVVNAEVGGHFGSWMIFVSLCLSFCEAEKGL